ncbi:MAG: putative lipid II flippase FtsW [Parcubacteria group bacterium]|nr:putative lipid II flippase FtsW [Parcubacteria group bacterium]
MNKIDLWFLSLVLLLAGGGFLIFLSASFGLLAREEGAKMSSIIFNQVFLGLLPGLALLFLVSKINYKIWKKYSFYIFLASIILTLLVFVPDIGLTLKGASRWVEIGSFSFQPAELLKLGLVLYLAAWFSGVRLKVQTIAYGLLPLFIFLGIVCFILLKQPDTGTLAVMLAAAVGIFFASGARLRDIAALVVMAIVGLTVLAYTRPYVAERILTFINPWSDVQGAGWQIGQALIAVGSGGLWGRGFGHGVQKFTYLPEPISDSIFAVAAEEFGLIGALVIILLFVFFAIRGFQIANRAPDYFSRLAVVGIVILITGQAFLNIGSMLAIFPLTGLPLPFISHGGTALLLTFIGSGIILNISRYCKN